MWDVNMEEHDDEMNEMYVSDTDLTMPRSQTPIRVFGGSSFIEIEIDGKKMAIVSPQVINRLDVALKTMQTKMSLLEQDLRNIRARLQSTEMMLRETRQELDNKISYER